MPFKAVLLLNFPTPKLWSWVNHKNKDLRTKAEDEASVHHVCLQSVLMFKECLQNKKLLLSPGLLFKEISRRQAVLWSTDMNSNWKE